MFDYNKMIKRAIEFFPRWTDIRKRYKTSNGGNLLGAILDESIKLEEAIQEYIDSYFLETYEGHENEVMAFSYMANVGQLKNLNGLTITYNNKLLMPTDKVRLFNEDQFNEYIYYEEGKFYIKESLYQEGVPLFIEMDDSIIEYQLTKYHVWNIFDEFATFVNTRRYENETNKELLDRILYITKNLPNGTEPGLKHAIISELMFFDPNIKEDDIKIERATPENLIKPYEDYESLLDKLMYINRDVFKCKRWDLDYWVYDFESISYIPHKWNETLSHWQNGIGHDDDLKVIISDASNTTDVKLTLYNKSTVAFEKYVQNKDIDYDVDFKLVKYNNVLNKSNIKYKVKASELVDITNEDINLHLYESSKIEEIRNIEELYAFSRNVDIVDKSVIPVSDTEWYRLKFKQKDNKDFKISKANVRYTNENTGRVEETKSLIKPMTGFLVNAEGELISSHNQKVIKRAEELSANNGLKTIEEGITIQDNNFEGAGIISAGSYAGMYFTIDHSCEKVDVPKNLIKSKGSYWNDANEFVIRGDYSIEDKKTIIEVEANSFEFRCVNTKITGRCTVTIIDNGMTKDIIVLEPDNLGIKNRIAVEETKSPRKIKIIIEVLSFNDIVFADFKYSNYVIDVSSEVGKLEYISDNKYRLPNNKNNNLIVSLVATTGRKPIIQKIVIGDSLNEVTYTTDYIESKSFCSRKFDVKTTADISLIKVIAVNTDIITNTALEGKEHLSRLVKELFTDDVTSYLDKKIDSIFKSGNKTQQELLLQMSDENRINTITDILNMLTEHLYNYMAIETVLYPYNTKLLDATTDLNDIITAITDKIDLFINDQKNKELFNSVEGLQKLKLKPQLDHIFTALSKTNITLIDKIEWHSLAMKFAEVLVSEVAKQCVVDLGEYMPTVEYKGNMTDANSDCFVRLDLSEYSSIESVTSNGGLIETILESGVVYYNLKLNGDKATTVTISGIKDKELRVVTLQDMIRFYIPDFNATNDSIMCSKLLDSIIVSRKNPGHTPYNMSIKLSSDMLSGLYVTKYELQLPTYIGSRYGNNTTASNDNPISYQPFDYISFYPAAGTLYESLNEFNSYTKNNREIRITNNFAPALDPTKLMVYTIENAVPMEKTKYVLRFHDETNKDNDIYDLDTWCIGQQFIAIQNNIDLFNDVSYTVNSYDINSKEYLSTMIDIKDSYTITNNMILDTTQYIVVPPENMTVKYEEYNGSSAKNHLIKVEEIIIDANKFNKLTYSNIDGIYHLSKTRYESSYKKDPVEYTLLGEQGIIIWGDNIEIGAKYYLVYTIKKPVGFLLDLEDLYKAIGYDVQAYNRLDTILLSNIKDDEDYKFSKIEKIDDVDLIHIDCSNPTFEGVVLPDQRVIRFNKYIEKPTLLIKSGYYYINGREYFLYSEDEDEQIVNNRYYGAENIDISGGEILTYKPTNNYITNTEMRLKGRASIYNYDCRQILDYGISTLNSLTACSSFNEWTYFAMNPKLVQGMNGLAMSFHPTLNCAYAYLDITNALTEDTINYISLLASSDLKIFIGKEENYLDFNFNRAPNIGLHEEIPYNGSEIRVASLSKNVNEHYYLVVLSAGILDDIIITTNRNDALNGHSKNIDLLGLDLLETKMQGTEYRMSIDDNKDYSPFEAALMSDGYFKTTSQLDWYITRVASFETEADFFGCVMENINVTKSYINTNTNTEGYILTPPIYVNNQETIKKLIFKINDVELDEMSGFKVIAYTSDVFDNNFNPIGSFNSNKGYILGENLMSYVKFKIEIPANKVISKFQVYVEYKSSADSLLKLPLHESGYIISKVYDLQDVLNYRLKDLGIDDISNINDIELYIRASRDIEKLEIWHDWQRIFINDDLTLRDYLKFYDVRYVQLKMLLKSRQSYIKFNHLDIEVI